MAESTVLYASVQQVRDFGVTTSAASDNLVSEALLEASRWIDDYTGSTFVNPSRQVTDGVTTNASATLTSATAAFSPGDTGKALSGAGIPVGAYILTWVSPTSVTMSANATATASGVTVTIGTGTGLAPTTVTINDVRRPLLDLAMRFGPFSNVTAVTINGSTIASTGYSVEPWGLRLYIPGFLDVDGFPRHTLTQVPMPRGYGNPYGSQVTVTATFGLSYVPTPVRRACVLVAAANITLSSDAEALAMESIDTQPAGREVQFKSEIDRYMAQAKDLLVPYAGIQVG